MAVYPVSYSIQRPERYNRWTVFFRVLLVIPQYLVLFGFPFTILGFAFGSDSIIRQALLPILTLVSLETVLGVLIFLAWFAILFTGRFPDGFLRVCIAIYRWQQNVAAYLFLLTDDYPPFGPGPYALQIEVTPTVEHDRTTVFFRLILVIPAAVVIGILAYALYALTFFAWWAIMFTGRYPRNMYGLGVGIARATARLAAYLYLFVDDYPPFSVSEETGTEGTQPQMA